MGLLLLLPHPLPLLPSLIGVDSPKLQWFLWIPPQLRKLLSKVILFVELSSFLYILPKTSFVIILRLLLDHLSPNNNIVLGFILFFFSFY